MIVHDEGSREPTSVYVRVELKDGYSIALVQDGLRNAGFDQLRSGLLDDPAWLEGTIAKGQKMNLLGVSHVDTVRVLHEAY